jgi:hypothetical protein
LLAVVLAAAASAGCASATATEPVHPHGRPSGKMAYLYGRFQVDTSLSKSLFGAETMTFEIRCRDGETYGVRFEKTSEPQMIAMKPAICQIEDVVYDDGTEKYSGSTLASRGLLGIAIIGAANEAASTAREMSSFRLLQNEELAPGGVYYVGDFFASAEYDGDKNVWTIKAKDDYAATTAAFKKKYARFAPVKTENRVSR